MTNKERYKRAFSGLHPSDSLSMEVHTMTKKKRTYISYAAIACASLLFVISSGTVAYANDLGGIQRTIQLWIHGDQTNAVLNVDEGTYHLTYQDSDGNTVERSGGGIAIDTDDTERPLTENELIEHLNMPEVEYYNDGSVWIYYLNQSLEITDMFDEDGICYVLLKSQDNNMYVTVKKGNGYSCSRSAYPQPWTFNP